MTKLRSDKVMKGITGAYARSMYRAIGYSEENLKKPKVAIVNSFRYKVYWWLQEFYW